MAVPFARPGSASAAPATRPGLRPAQAPVPVAPRRPGSAALRRVLGQDWQAGLLFALPLIDPAHR